MRHILFLLFMALTLQAIAQYPATGNKMRLGWQTTGDGLVYRGAIGDTATLDPSGINNAWMLLDTSSGNLYAYRAKAWRLVSGGGGLTMPFDSVTFNVNETDASLRELKYSEEKGYLQYGGQDSVQIPILPGIWYVRNDTSVTIPKGTVLRATGTLGASGRIKVKHMIANGSIDAMYILGIAMHDIAVGADGYAMSQGKIRKINTQAYSEGAVLYADVDTLGGLTQTEPTGSNLKLPIAFVVNSASNGTIAVRVTSGAYMRDLHDAEITSPVSNASLYYNAAQGVWRDTGAAVLVADTSAMLTNYVNVVDTAAMLTNYINIADTATMLSSYISNADTSVFARDFQISGTTNYLPKFTAGSTVGNSPLYNVANNQFIIGHTASGTGAKNTLEIQGTGNTDFDGSKVDLYVNSSGQDYHTPIISLRRSRSATAGAFTKANDLDWLGQVIFNGADGDEYTGGALIRAIVDGTTGNNDMPASLLFATTPDGSSTQTERMRITSAGRVGIGTSTPSEALDVNGVGRFRQSGGSGGGPIEISDRKSTFNQNINWNVYYDGSNWKYRNSDFGASIGFNNSGDLIFANIASGTAGNNVTAFRERLRINENGNVGIGTASPLYKLSVAKYTSGTTQGEIVQSIIGNTVYSTVGQWAGLSLGTYADKVGIFAYDGYNNFGRNDLVFAVASGGNTNPVTLTDEKMRILNNGNVGINTSSPSRPLHINETSAIRIPVGNFAQRGTSDNGDIRVRTDTASMEYYSGAWRTVAPMARVPQSGLANRFAKFDANGLLDTSAVLVQSNGRIGIGTASPTAGFMLDVVGGDARINGMTVGLGGSNVGSNLAFGNGALASWDGTGSGTNVAIGALALNLARQTLGASSNLAIGGNALRVNTNTANNVAIGADAMRFYNKTGAGAGGGNVAIGGGALYYLEASASTPVANNVAIGLASMLYTQNSDANACIGTNSMRHAQGNDNVAIGQASLASSDPGTPDYRTGISQNVSIGASAMQNIVANTTGNIAIGKSALGLSNYEGDNGVYIGLSANASSTTATNEIVIGANTTGNGSNTTTIGNSSTTATILPAGSLSVSTTSTTNKLNINGNAVIGSSYIGTAAPADGLLVVGNVGIGASSVDYKLHCAGVGYFGTGLRVDYTAAFSDSTIFQLPNTATKKARAFAWATYSDARIKSNFDTIQNALQAVQALKPVYYDQHDSEVIDGKIKLQDGKTRTVGFIAQDVAPVIPAAVQAGNDTQLWGMDYTKLIPYLTKAIQEQQAQIEALKKEIEALKNK